VRAIPCPVTGTQASSVRGRCPMAHRRMVPALAMWLRVSAGSVDGYAEALVWVEVLAGVEAGVAGLAAGGEFNRHGRTEGRRPWHKDKGKDAWAVRTRPGRVGTAYVPSVGIRSRIRRDNRVRRETALSVVHR